MAADDFRPRVVKCAREIAARHLRPPYPMTGAAVMRFASKVHRAPASDLVFTDLMTRLDPDGNPCLEVAVSTDGGLTAELEKVWEAAAKAFDPEVDTAV